MLDKKLTDEEIISSLEVIATTCNCNECKIRSGKWGTCNCSETTANAALDLINHQKLEIDSLRSDLKRVCAERDAHICTNNFIKSEAYKEFSERLVYTLCINNEENTEFFDYAYTLETINNLVKELISDE